jgi:glycosyltransferase involved in cell wall biosynthesis
MSNILLYNHDIQKYPPILTAIKILKSLGEEIVVIGYCSDKNTVEKFQAEGIIYHNVIVNDINQNKLTKLLKLQSYRKRVKKIIQKEYKENSVLWIYGNQNIWLLYKLVLKYKSILYLFEVPQLKVSFRYKMLSPLLNYKKTMQNAWKVVCCEYNRAHLTKAFFNLPTLPVIIPNKPDFDLTDTYTVNDEVLQKLKNKKVILYQGIFNYPERKLEELCQSIDFLPSEYIVCLMGSDDQNKARLRMKYESERVLFLPYIPAPHHLHITKNAYIGFLTYFSEQGSVENALNTLYCAPNKIYEYASYKVPMLSNDVPALAYQFDTFNAGKTVPLFNPEEIASKILEIDENYEVMSEGAFKLFNSVDIQNLYAKLIL